MMRKVIGTLVAIAALAVSTTPAEAQSPFVQGYTDIGPVVGLGGIGGAGMSLGARFERGIKPLPDLGNGMLGIMVSFNYYSYDDGFGGSQYNLSYMPIGVTANYHFTLTNPKIDPFLGLGLGYVIISCDFPNSGFGDPCSNSSIYFIGRAGARYFYRPNMAFYADLGSGYAFINLGVMFKLR